MADWQQIDLGDARIDGLVVGADVMAWGEREGRPFAARVEAGGAVVVADLPGTGPVTSATYNEYYELSVGQPPVHLAGDFPGGFAYDDSWEVPSWTIVESPARFWVGCGDEDAMYVAADADGQLVGVDPGVGSVGRPSGLFVADDAPLLVAGREVGIQVAGRLRGPTGQEALQLWICWGVEGATGSPDWQQVPLDPAPDGLTDLFEAHDPVLAGHRDGRPLVWSDQGQALDVPDVRLDPAWPVVSVVAGSPLTLALQTEDGPALFTREVDGWSRVELPLGHLVVARLADDRTWAVVNGALWMGATG